MDKLHGEAIHLQGNEALPQGCARFISNRFKFKFTEVNLYNQDSPQKILLHNPDCQTYLFLVSIATSRRARCTPLAAAAAAAGSVFHVVPAVRFGTAAAAARLVVRRRGRLGATRR